MAVTFHYSDTNFRFRSTIKVKHVVQRIISDHGKTTNHISVIVCSDRYLLTVNQDYLNHDDLTDVITFDLSENNGIVGEIYISIERVKENARIFKTGFLNEACRVIFHGALHLVGYKDKTPEEIHEMRGAEKKYLTLFEELFHVKQKNVD